jgi:hypothetical protein
MPRFKAPMLAASVADAAFDARLAERRHYVVLARPL